ncbi:hypothetical protein SUGI_0561300 [Cryptomeria japonica]|uniref:homeobox-leucine zipper protein HOX3 n=1 Tax=Cryptomeria japonica TaxID=3369 RepID=UPI002408DBF1|nr:homeobox-leucine zipper protein HOX3 [Cryptomeria japonica]GLJ28529.1 hypothetical protein SUGI_0561300 [Cryptomeria japonica]
MEMVTVDCDEGVEHAFQSDRTPVSSHYLHHASACLECLPSEQKTSNEKSEGSNPNSLDLNKTPPSDGQDDLQKDFNLDNRLLRISNEQEKVGIKRGQRLTEEQYAYLEQCYKENNKMSEDYIQMEALANKLDISPRKVQVWFRNRRRRIKTKQNKMVGTELRFRFSEEQYANLEECFKQNNTVDKIQLEALANLLNVSRRKVQVWFQNRRKRNKRKQNEMDSGKQENVLREEKKRMHKELAEIKAPETPPAAPLVGCPSCQRVISTTRLTTSG